MKTQFVQKQSISKSGSFFNWLMANNATIPVAGEFATILMYSDRDVIRVDSVSNCGKKVVVEMMNTIANKEKNHQMGHQNWIHQPTGQFYSIEYRNNSWKRVGEIIEFTDEFQKSIPAQYRNEKFGFINIVQYLRNEKPELYEQIYLDDVMPMVVVDGITKAKKTYSKINIMFDVCNYHYDWEF